MLLDSKSDKHTATESRVTVLSTSDTVGMKANTDIGKLARPENGKLKEMLGAADTMPDKDSGVLATMEVTDNADLVGPKYRQHPIESPTTSGTVLGSKLSGSDNKNVGGQVTGGSTSETHSSEAKLNEGAQCISEGDPTKAYCSVQALDSQAVETGASDKKVLSLVDLVKSAAEKAELNSKNIKTLKQGTLSDPKEDYKCFTSFDVSESNPKDSKYDIRSAESSQQDKPSNPNEAHGMKSERRSQVKGLVDCLLEHSKDTQKNPS